MFRPLTPQSAHSPGVLRAASGRLSAALLAVLFSMPASAGPAVAPHPKQELSVANQSPVSGDQLSKLNYRIVGKRDLVDAKKAAVDPTLDQQLDLLSLDRSRQDYKKIVNPDPKPPLNLGHWVPSWLGTTGGLDLPWAYCIPKGQLAVGLIAKDRSADNRFWPQVYNSIDGADRGLTLTYGVMDGIEVTADVDRWDRNFTYAPQGDITNIATPATSASFHSNRTILGGGLKGTAATEDLQFAFGFHTAGYKNIDRNIIEFHDYDRMNNFYVVASTSEERKLAAHFSARYVTYDWDGSVFPSGATTGSDPTGTGAASSNGLFVDPAGIARRGFAPGRAGQPVFQRRDGTLTQDASDPTITGQVGSGTNNWFNLGFGADFEPSKHFRLIGEINWETGIKFSGAEDWFVNVGGRYTRRNWAGTFGLRHVNSRGYREPLLSVAYRF